MESMEVELLITDSVLKNGRHAGLTYGDTSVIFLHSKGASQASSQSKRRREQSLPELEGGSRMEITEQRKETEHRRESAGADAQRDAVRKLIEAEIRNVVDEEMRKAAQELMEEQRRAIRQMVEEQKAVIREAVEEEKKAIWTRVEEMRQSISKIGLR